MNPNFIYKYFLGEFYKIVEEFPGSIAISSESGQISYSELNSRVTKVSHKLYEFGIRKGDVVALWMEKSPEYIEAILAIWNLGAVFLPLDAKTPEKRVDWICRDAKVKLLITNDLLPQRHRDTEIDGFATVYIKDFILLVRGRKSKSNEIIFSLPAFRYLQSNDVAYIIYTSGSTGNPKGVVVTHEGIVNFLEKQIEVFQVNCKSKILQYLSIGFDASLSEIGISLLSGATIRIEKEEKVKTTDGLIEILDKERISHICLPPSLLPILPIEQMPNSLETIIIGGEVCPVETVRTWASQFRLVNVYGPTEATVCSSLVVCESNWDKPLIGISIPNREFHILDENLIPVRESESGELYLSGVGLSSSYLNEEELTREKFLFVNGIRMYKTGDRVLKHSLEEIEFLGRMDRQFKLRGNLIEPSEVERVLTSYPSISFAHVKKCKLNREVLVAYIQFNPLNRQEKQLPSEIGNGKNSNSLMEIKQYLSKLLPRWMVPERFVVLEKIPLNANEKLDVNALPLLESSRPSYLPNYVEPDSDLERTLCEVLERILLIKPIGLEDDFFVMGGDSISMISFLTECSLLGITLSPEKFIQNSTVKGILENGVSEMPNTSSVRFLEKETLLDLKISQGIQNTSLTKNKFSKVLLTGATGFLGSRILYELIQNTNTEVYCIVRNLKDRNPKKIVEENFSSQRIKIQNWNRVHFIEGDISKPNLGLSQFDWEFLTSQVDTVFHFAAEVNLLLPYNKLKENNIESTKEILKFCTTKSRKYLHYASTLSVFVSTNDPRKIFYENDDLDTMQEVYGGYAQTKWVSEKILLNALRAGMDSINIYRFGLVTGDSETGFGKKGDFFSQFLESLLQVKILPKENVEELKVDITPVDFAAKTCMAIARSNSNASVFHIANRNSLRLFDLVSILKELGILISFVPGQEFIHKCKSIGLEQSYFYLSLSRLLLDEIAFTLIRPLDLFQATGIQFDLLNTDEVISNSSIVCPYPKKKLIEKYLLFLVNSF